MHKTMLDMQRQLEKCNFYDGFKVTTRISTSCKAIKIL